MSAGHCWPYACCCVEHQLLQSTHHECRIAPRACAAEPTSACEPVRRRVCQRLNEYEFSVASGAMRAASQRCEATCDLRTKHWSKMKHTSFPSVSIDAYMKGFCHILPCLARPCTYAELRATHSHTVTWSRTVAVAVTVAVATTTAATATATAAQAPCLVLSHSSLSNTRAQT